MVAILPKVTTALAFTSTVIPANGPASAAAPNDHAERGLADHPLSSSTLPKAASSAPRVELEERRLGVGGHSSTQGKTGRIVGCAIGGAGAALLGAYVGNKAGEKISGRAPGEPAGKAPTIGAIVGGLLFAGGVGAGCAEPEIRQAIEADHGSGGADPGAPSPSPSAGLLR